LRTAPVNETVKNQATLY